MTYILVLNAGSSSLKYKLFRGDVELLAGHIESIGKAGVSTVHKGTSQLSEQHETKNHLDAVEFALSVVKREVAIGDISHVAHRVVHGGEKYSRHAVISDKLEIGIDELSALAPLHNPSNLACIKAAKKMLPKAVHIACFDTAFHHSIPKHAYLYGLPLAMYEKWGLRKYGFHGLSHEYVTKVLYERTGKTDKIITCHLGAGSSIAAIHHGKCIDTTMGFTPLDGLLMATRTGALDPQIPVFLMEHEHMNPKQITELLNKESGLKGLTGHADLREVKKLADQGNEMAQVAIEMLCYRLANAIGSYHIALGGVRTITFTGGIGEHADWVREKVCSYLSTIGVLLDKHANEQHKPEISAQSSRINVLVIPANEELHMARIVLSSNYVTQA